MTETYTTEDFERALGEARLTAYSPGAATCASLAPAASSTESGQAGPQEQQDAPKKAATRS
jgi:hypothetical protein